MNEPKSFRAGNTVTWTEEFNDYPADQGWTATYYLRGPQSSIDVPGNASGKGFIFTITAADCAQLASGIYKYFCRVEKAPEAFTPTEGTIVVLPNLAAQSSYDGRTTAEIMLEASEATMTGRATKEQKSMSSSSGKALELLSPAELRSEYFLWKQAVREEQAGEAASKGLDTGGKILTRHISTT